MHTFHVFAVCCLLLIATTHTKATRKDNYDDIVGMKRIPLKESKEGVAYNLPQFTVFGNTEENLRKDAEQRGEEYVPRPLPENPIKPNKNGAKPGTEAAVLLSYIEDLGKWVEELRVDTLEKGQREMAVVNDAKAGLLTDIVAHHAKWKENGVINATEVVILTDRAKEVATATSDVERRMQISAIRVSQEVKHARKLIDDAVEFYAAENRKLDAEIQSFKKFRAQKEANDARAKQKNTANSK